jgi:hypothetical protein
VQLIDIGAFAGAKTQTVQTDTMLFERRAGLCRRWRINPDRGASADAVIGRVGVDDRLHAQERQQLTENSRERSKFEAVRKIWAMPLTSHELPLARKTF